MHAATTLGPASPPTRHSGSRVEHPFLLTTRDAFATLQARARKSPWREMKAAALADVESLRFNPAALIRTRSVVLARIFSTAALVYILEPDLRARCRQRILEHMDCFAAGTPGSLTDAMRGRVDKTDWNYATPTGNAFFQAVLALDVIHDDVPAGDLVRVAAILRDGPARYFAETKLAWRQGSLAARAIWPLYERDVAAYQPIVDEWIADVRHALSADGVFIGGPGYADCRWTYLDREHKAMFGEVLAHAGILPDWYAEPRVVAFHEWFNGYAFTSFRVCWTFGDTAPERHWPRYQQGPERAYRYSALAGRYAAWLREGSVPPAGIGSYVLTESVDAQPAAAPSRVFPDGGAWLKEASVDPQSLSAALWNLKSAGDAHAHKETNAICLAAYGELLLRNSGYNGWATPDRGFSWSYIHDRAIAGNVALFDYATPATPAQERDPPAENDHIARNGSGIVSSLLTGVIDFARGDSGAAIPNGQHLRDLIFVHPSDGVAGYYVAIDAFDAPGCRTGQVVWHPNSDRYVVDAEREQYTWTSDEFRGSDVSLTLFCAVPPRDVAIAEGGLANWRHGKVGKYLVVDYALDAAGRGRAITVLCPHDAAHPRATFERSVSGGGTVRQRDVEDVTFLSDGTSRVSPCVGVRATARAGLIRRSTTNGTVLTAWLDEATSFETPGFAFRTTSPVTICWRGNVVHVVAAVDARLTYGEGDGKTVLLASGSPRLIRLLDVS